MLKKMMLWLRIAHAERDFELTQGTRVQYNTESLHHLCFAEILYDRTNQHEFTTLTKQLASPGTLNQSKIYSFEFPHVEKPYESYFGINVRLW